MDLRNRLLYHTLRRCGQAMLYLAGCAVSAVLLLLSVELSNSYLGSPIPSIIVIAIAAICACAYAMAKDDVRREDRDRERILDRLSRE